MPVNIQGGDGYAIYTITGWREAMKVLFGGYRLKVVVEGLGPNPMIKADPYTTIKSADGKTVQEGQARR